MAIILTRQKSCFVEKNKFVKDKVISLNNLTHETRKVKKPRNQLNNL